MENINKKIILAALTLCFFLLSFILFHNDLINYLIISVTITVILFIYLCCVVFIKKKNKSTYTKDLNKILKTYDSILVYSDDYEIEEKNVTFVKNIYDLVKYCDEINKTIVFIEEEETSAFIMKNDKELLVYIMRKDEYSRSNIEQKIHNYLKNKGDNNE